MSFLVVALKRSLLELTCKTILLIILRVSSALDSSCDLSDSSINENASLVGAKMVRGPAEIEASRLESCEGPVNPTELHYLSLTSKEGCSKCQKSAHRENVRAPPVNKTIGGQ